jgi:hypothetical protein
MSLQNGFWRTLKYDPQIINQLENGRWGKIGIFSWLVLNMG